MRKRTTSTEGTPEGLLKMTYSIRVLRTTKKTEGDGSEMASKGDQGVKSGKKRARTVGCTNSIDHTHGYYLQHATYSYTQAHPNGHTIGV